MARIVVNTYMVRHPLGGNLSWALQWVIGLERLGHDVYIVEKGDYPNACFDLPRLLMTDDCTYGVATVRALLTRFGLQDRCIPLFAGLVLPAGIPAGAYAIEAALLEPTLGVTLSRSSAPLILMP